MFVLGTRIGIGEGNERKAYEWVQVGYCGNGKEFVRFQHKNLFIKFDLYTVL